MVWRVAIAISLVPPLAVVGLLVFAWLLIHRFRVGYLQDQIDERGLSDAIAERRAEGQL
jgi:hypothetical protein